MHAVVIDRPGGPEVLTWQEVPDPEPGPGEVLLDVAASAVNRADTMQRSGGYDPPPGASPYPGLECAGTIAALGAGVTDWSVGDRVCALLAGGGYAERVAVPAAQVLPVPGTLTFTEAAALPEVACTVFSTVFMVAGLQPGERFLVHGGGSGIGTFAIQLAKAAGAAQVLCTAGSAAKLAACRELGADVGIDYHEEDFAERVREATEGAGVDVVLDIVGAPYLEPNLRSLATNGRLALIGLQGGPRTEIDLGLLLGKRLAVVGTTLRSRPLEEKASIVAAVRENVWPLVADGRVRPIVDRVLPMAEAATAHQVMGDSTHTGKIVLAT